MHFCMIYIKMALCKNQDCFLTIEDILIKFMGCLLHCTNTSPSKGQVYESKTKSAVYFEQIIFRRHLYLDGNNKNPGRNFLG